MPIQSKANIKDYYVLFFKVGFLIFQLGNQMMGNFV